jgi:GT2 family glycosyltransferase
MVYVVILNWNGLEDTIECLSSIAELLHPKVKAIIVDNASRNAEADVIEARFPDAVVLRQDENLGFCGGCNVGIQYALDKGADYVMLLNNDTLVLPDLIEQLLGGTDGVENVGAVSPLIFEHPQADKVWFSKAEWDTSRAQFRLDARGDGDTGPEPFLSEFACGCCMLIPADALRRVGLLDERYFAFYDEADWCARARKVGLGSWVIPSAKMYHKVSRSTPGLVSTYLLSRNRLLWMKENLPFRIRLKSLTYLLKEYVWHRANLLGLTGPAYSKEHSRAVVRGYSDYFRGKFYKWDRSTEGILFGSRQ